MNSPLRTIRTDKILQFRRCDVVFVLGKIVFIWIISIRRNSWRNLSTSKREHEQLQKQELREQQCHRRLRLKKKMTEWRLFLRHRFLKYEIWGSNLNASFMQIKACKTISLRILKNKFFVKFLAVLCCITVCNCSGICCASQISLHYWINYCQMILTWRVEKRLQTRSTLWNPSDGRESDNTG